MADDPVAGLPPEVAGPRRGRPSRGGGRGVGVVARSAPRRTRSGRRWSISDVLATSHAWPDLLLRPGAEPGDLGRRRGPSTPHRSGSPPGIRPVEPPEGATPERVDVAAVAVEDQHPARTRRRSRGEQLDEHRLVDRQARRQCPAKGEMVIAGAEPEGRQQQHAIGRGPRSTPFGDGASRRTVSVMTGRCRPVLLTRGDRGEDEARGAVDGRGCSGAVISANRTVLSLRSDSSPSRKGELA